MARVLLACSRDDQVLANILTKMAKMNLRLTPDNVAQREPQVIRKNHTLITIFNPPPDMDQHDGSICLGKMMPIFTGWWQPGSPVPDGSFALFRVADGKLEIVSDVVGTRSIWYYLDEDVFLASNSQRAILSILGDFSLNSRVIPWMLSAGSTGPGQAWDDRLKLLPTDARLSLDIHSWETAVSEASLEFKPETRPASGHETLLRQAILDTFNGLNLDYNQWLLPLSGGYDSRAILLHLQERSGLKCITWGVKSSLQDSRNDAFIARQLAQECGVNFHYFAIEAENEPLAQIFDRFIAAGEGRIDHVSGYMDGFKIWQHLFQQNTSGVIRGDEGFGWTKVFTEYDVLRYTGLVSMQDHRNLQSAEKYGISAQSIPAGLHQQANESLSTWRDRIYHQFRIPVVLSALNEIKCAYVEVVNPLLSRKIIQQVRTLPDSLRTEKALFKKIITEISPPVDFAELPAIVPAVNYLSSSQAVSLFRTEMEELHGQNILPDVFVDWVAGNLKSNDQAVEESGGRRLKDWIPATLRPLLKSLYGKQNISINRLAFRIFLIGRMRKIIAEDIRSINAWECGDKD